MGNIETLEHCLNVCTRNMPAMQARHNRIGCLVDTLYLRGVLIFLKSGHICMYRTASLCLFATYFLEKGGGGRNLC